MNKISKKLLALMLMLCFIPTVSFAAEGDKLGEFASDTEQTETVTEPESTETPNTEETKNEASEVQPEKTPEPTAAQKNQNMMLMIYLGVYDANLLPGDYVTRGLFTKFVSIVTDLDESTSDSASKYSDVLKTSPFYNYVGVMSDMEIIGGYGDGTFKPDENIKMEHAVKVLMKAAGYSVYINPDKNETSQYLSLATSEGLLKGIDFKGDTDMNFNTCANLFRNFLEMHTVEISMVGSTLKFEKSTNTIMGQKMKVGKTTGIVTDDGISSLDGATSIQSGKIKIDNMTLANPNNFADLLGRKITAFYSLSDEFETMLIYYFEDKNEQIIEFSADDCEDFSNGVYTYHDKNGRKRTLKLSDNYVVIYNGIAVVTKEHWDKVLMNPEMGNIRLLSNGKDGKYNVVFIDSYTNIVIDSFSASNKSVVDLITKKPYYFEEKEYESLTFEDETGFKLDYEDIQRTGAILSLFDSADGKTRRVVISGKTVTGSVSGIDSEKITINDATYELADNFKKMLDNGTVVNPGGNYTVYIDFSGKVTFAKSTYGEDGLKNGIIIKYTNIEETDDDWYMVKIYSDKETKSYYLNTKTVVNGVRMKTKTLADNCFDLSKNSQRVIRFTADDKDVLRQVYTVGSDKLVFSGSASNARISTTYQSFASSGKYYLYKPTAKVIAYSNLESIENVKDITTYDTVTEHLRASGEHKDNSQYTYSFYKFDGESVFADLVVVEGPYVKMSPAEVYQNPTAFMIVKDIKQVYDEAEGDIKYCLTVFNGTAETEIYAACGNSMRFGNKFSYDQNGEMVEKGDIIRYTANINGEIESNGFVVLYNKSAKQCVNPSMLDEKLGNSELTGTNETGYFIKNVEIIDREGTAVIYNFEKDPTERIINMTGTNCRVLEYDTVSNQITPKTVSELYGSNSYGADGEKCVMYKYDTTVNFVLYK